MPLTAPDANYSLQGCHAGEVGRSRRRKRYLGGDEFGLPLFQPHRRKGLPDARVARAGTREGVACLSIGHNPTPSDSSAPEKAPKVPTAALWIKGARVDSPGIRNRGRTTNQQKPKIAKRGKILSFSESSRRYLQALCATVDRNAEFYTMALTCPGYALHLTNPAVKFAFLTLMTRLGAKAQRDARFAPFAFLWKQELQSRGELHFHLLMAGVAAENLAAVWEWVVEKWIELLMEIPGMPAELREDEVSKMRKVHFNAKNFERVRGNFHSYFAKYLGKAEKQMVADEPIPGRWWGCYNRASMPFAAKAELVLPERVNVHAHRVMRKIRQKRADQAKHRFLCVRLGLVASSGDKKEPLISQFGLQGRRGEMFRLIAAEMCTSQHAETGIKPEKFGRYRFNPAMKFAPVRLTGNHVPAMYLRILQYAGNRAVEDAARTPF